MIVTKSKLNELRSSKGAFNRLVSRYARRILNIELSKGWPELMIGKSTPLNHFVFLKINRDAHKDSKGKNRRYNDFVANVTQDTLKEILLK